MKPFSLLALLCSLAAAALASPLLLLKDCSRGSEVWCQNLQTASNCKAVKHCRQNVWNKPTVKSIPCDLCKDVISVAGKLMKENTTEEEVHACLYKTCEFLAGQDLVTECKEIVDAYLPNILDMIKEELDSPEVVCNALTLCQSLQKHLATVKLQKQLQSNKIPELDFSELASPFMANVPLLLYPQDKPKQEPQGNDNVCKDCVQLITDIQEAVKSNATFVSSLIHHAEEECDHLFPAFADMCKTYISQYSDMAIQLLMHMQPEDICKIVGFCTSLKSVPLQTLVPAKPKVETPKNSLSQGAPSFLCQVCQTMVNEVVSFLERNKTEEEIVSELKEVCSLFPEEYREQCKDFVDIYGKPIIDLLLGETDPNTVCLFLKCCTEKVSQAEKVSLVQGESDGPCDVCKMIVAYADKELAKNATTAEIEAFLERACRLFPASISDQCVQFVDEYESTIVQLLAEMMDPTFVCTKLGVCVASTQPLLGSEFCVRGPGYWCKNMETASQCNAVEHCKRHVWN